MSLKDKAAIIGVGCSQFAENWTHSAEDMIARLTRSSLLSLSM